MIAHDDYQTFQPSQIVRLPGWSSADTLGMDVTTVSGASAFQQQKLQANVQTSVDVKALNIAKSLGAGALQLLQGASQGFTAPTATAGPSSSGGLDTFA